MKTMCKMTNTLSGINSRLNIPEEKICALKHNSINYPKWHMQRKINKNNEQRINQLWGNFKQFNKGESGVPNRQWVNEKKFWNKWIKILKIW